MYSSLATELAPKTPCVTDSPFYIFRYMKIKYLLFFFFSIIQPLLFKYSVDNCSNFQGDVRRCLMNIPKCLWTCNSRERIVNNLVHRNQHKQWPSLCQFPNNSCLSSFPTQLWKVASDSQWSVHHLYTWENTEAEVWISCKSAFKLPFFQSFCKIYFIWKLSREM